MKYFLIFLTFCVLKCKSQNIKRSNDLDGVLTEEVKYNLLRNISKDDKNYIFFTKNENKKQYTIKLGSCNKCYFEKFIENSQNLISLNSEVSLILLDEDIINNYKPNKEVIITTGGLYILIIDFNGKIITSYTSD